MSPTGLSLDSDNHGEFWLRSYLRVADEKGARDWLRAWVETAYLDMVRALHKIGDSEEATMLKQRIREAGTELLIGKLDDLRGNLATEENEFDTWHRAACLALVDLYCRRGYQDSSGQSKFRIGHAQKWVNISIKYAVHLGTHLPDYGGIYDFCHAPIDNRVLEAFRSAKKLKKELSDFPDFRMAWSALSNYETEYLPIQSWIRRKFVDPPLDVEFRAFVTLDVRSLQTRALSASIAPSPKPL